MTTHWQSAPTDLQLIENHVHLWLVHLPYFYGQVDLYYSLLSAKERERADRFMFDKHRKPYVISVAFLRKILHQYLTVEPSNVQFSYGENGKPYLNNTHLKFNMSRSKEFALYGFVLNHEIGVDIEKHRSNIHRDGIIESQFSTLEHDQYLRLSSSVQLNSFFKGWACKEAYIKAVGKGLSFPLREFSVDMDPAQPAKLKDVFHDERNAVDWTLQMINGPIGYSCAFAIKLNKPHVHCYLIDPENATRS